MYKGFKLEITKIQELSHLNSYSDVYDISKEKNLLESTLNSFILSDGNIDASKMQKNWFPKINADIFLSHSHKDQKLANKLANFFKSKNLITFIDSCIWGYSDDLLKKIDDKYCYNDKNKTYYYNRRNISTAHVHMMLSTALTMMIDKCECLIFLNTPNSIKPSDFIYKNDKTISPWIYHELSISSMLSTNTPERKKEIFRKSANLLEGNFPHFLYLARLDHLKNLYISKLMNIKSNKYDFLDEIYLLDIKPDEYDFLYEIDSL